MHPQNAGDLRTIRVLDHGLVRLVDHMGSDTSIIRAARVSYDAAWRSGEDEQSDRRLLRRLWSGGKAVLPESPKHSTPFEAVAVTFEVKAPVFVFRQWHRHRTQSYNELSLRYKELQGEEFYVPEVDVIGVQSATNKQVRSLDLPLSQDRRDGLNLTRNLVHKHHQDAFALYKYLLQCGWPRELARGVLPFNTYSHMFATANLLNWLRFLTLRDDEHAQHEIRVYAEAIATLLGAVVPETMALYRASR